MSKKIIIALIVFAIELCRFAQAAISGPALTIFPTASPRIIAMGGAYVAVADDSNAVFLNPAGLGNIGRSEIVINYGALLGNIDQATLSACFSANGFGNFGAGYNRFGVYDIPVSSTAPTNYLQDDLSIAYGLKIVDNFSCGLSINRFSEQYTPSLSMFAEGYGMNAAILYEPLRQIRLGMLIDNFASTNYKNSSGGEERISPDATLGVAFQPDNLFLIAADANVINVGDTQALNSISLGLEHALFGNFKIRLGYSSSKDNDYKATGALGVGFNVFNNLRFDYALQHTGEYKYSSNYFAMGYKF